MHCPNRACSGRDERLPRMPSVPPGPKSTSLFDLKQREYLGGLHFSAKNSSEIHYLDTSNSLETALIFDLSHHAMKALEIAVKEHLPGVKGLND